MTVDELIEALQNISEMHGLGEYPVVVIEQETGEIMHTKKIEAEHHEDAGSSFTVWLKSVSR